jgi:hypothetical protein
MNGCSDDACFRWLKWIGGVVADAKAADAPSAIMVVLHSLGAAPPWLLATRMRWRISATWWPS